MECPLIPAGVLSLSIRPLANAPLYLLPSVTKRFNSVSIEHLVGESCYYHCEYKCNDWNEHRGEVLMIYNSHIILVTKQRHINSLLDDRMAVWTMTFPAIPALLVTKWGQYPIS
jgi:hypothetical protein